MKWLRQQSAQPYLALCLSMVWVSIATEMPNFTDGRPSFTGNLALQCVVGGLLLWILCEFFIPKAYAWFGRHAPLLSAALCIILPVTSGSPFYMTALILFGVSCGIFLGSSMTEYLSSDGRGRRLLQIGISAGIYTTAVYPFGVAYTLLSSHVSDTILRFVSYALLCALAFCVFRLRKRKNMFMEPISRRELIFGRHVWITIAMLFLIILFAGFNGLLLSGVLEQNGGTFNAPWVYFVNVALRLPMGLLMGWFAGKGKWYYAIGLPLGMMVTGCAVSLFSGGAVSDYAMIGLYNCGGAAFTMLIHILGMQAAFWCKYQSPMAALGSLVHFVLVSFLNINALHITPGFFGETLRQPLTLAVIIASLPLFFMIMVFLINHKLMEIAETFFAMRKDTAALTEARDKDHTTQLEQTHNGRFSAFESRIAAFLIDGMPQSEIARRLHLTAEQMRESINAIRERVIGSNEPDILIADITAHYNLTRRETDILRCLCLSMTNAAIAAELFLSEGTVKIHVRNLMKKLPPDNRQEIPAWVETLDTKAGQ